MPEQKTIADEIMGLLFDIKDDMGGLKSSVFETIRAVDGIRIDIKNIGEKNIENALEAKAAHRRIDDLKPKVDLLISRNDRVDGSTQTVKFALGIFWTVFGGGITALGFFVIQGFFSNGP